MYLRTTKVKRADGRIDEYIRLVESQWHPIGHPAMAHRGSVPMHLLGMSRSWRPDAGVRVLACNGVVVDMV